MIGRLYLIEISLMLAVGARAPEFTLPDQDGRDTSLTSLLNRGPLVLFFYPADFTPGCTEGSLHDARPPFGARGARAQRGRHQSAGRRRAIAASGRNTTSPFRLLSDPDKAVVSMYEVMGPLGIGVRRATYLIDPSRHVRDAVLADFRIGRHEDFVRAGRWL